MRQEKLQKIKEKWLICIHSRWLIETIMENTRFDFLRIIFSFIFLSLRYLIWIYISSFLLKFERNYRISIKWQNYFSLHSLNQFFLIIDPIVYIVFNLGLIKQSENTFYDQITYYHTAVPCATSLYLHKKLFELYIEKSETKTFLA